MRKLKIGGYSVKVIFTEIVNDDLGYCDLANCRIIIDNSVPLDVQKSTLIHEIFEFLMIDGDLYGTEITHDRISVISSTIFQVLVDNKWLREFLS